MSQVKRLRPARSGGLTTPPRPRPPAAAGGGSPSAPGSPAAGGPPGGGGPAGGKTTGATTAASTTATGGVGSAGEGANDLALGIEDIESDFLGGLGKIVIDARLVDVALDGGRLEEVDVFGEQGGLQLAQGADVVEHIEGAAVSGDDHVCALDDNVGDLDVGQVERDGLPLRAIIEGNEDA